MKKNNGFGIIGFALLWYVGLILEAVSDAIFSSPKGRRRR